MQAGQKLLSYGRSDVGTSEAAALNLLATQRSLVLLKNGPSSGARQPVLPLVAGRKTAVLGLDSPNRPCGCPLICCTEHSILYLPCKKIARETPRLGLTDE